MPWYAAWKTRFCRAVSARSRLGRWGTTDSRLRAVTGSAATSTPATLAVPDVGSTRVVRTPIVVVFPAPLGPSRPKTSPRSTANEIPSTAFVGRPG
jgi:hypothetical protein